MSAKQPRAIQAQRRALIQAAKFAIRDIYDAIVELVTNADDRYQLLGCSGAIHIEVERRRGKNLSILRVRDFADGMDAETMERKLSILGGRESGLDKGAEVRGTHSRGAKDIAALGHVTFESIASDGRFHRCEITPFLEFVPHESMDLSDELRDSIGIADGTGTLVTIVLDKNQQVPQHDNLREQLRRLVPLRGILSDDRRSVLLRDPAQEKEDRLTVVHVEGAERIKETFEVSGYPGVRAKLSINRAKNRFERENERFRLGGIRIESKHAIHQSTLFDSALESDSHALWFYGRLVCEHIDDLCNEFDELFESHKPAPEHNPTYPLDPSRRAGLNREHPFVKALFAEALRRLRPLVEEERRREEHEKAAIESASTQKRLRALEKAALDFMQDFGEEDEPSREPDSRHPESRFMEKGFSMSPPFVQMIRGHSQLFWLNVRQQTFPELEQGSSVQIECMSHDIVADKHFCALEPHPNREGVLRAVWKVNAVNPSPATGLTARVGPILAESAIEVFSCEADRFRDVTCLRFSKKRYRIATERKHRAIRILAPIRQVPTATEIRVSVDSEHFTLSGQQVLLPNPTLEVAICDLSVKCDGKEATGVLSARLGEQEASASVISTPPLGAGLSIKIEDIDLVNQRYRWRQNVLEIAARHPSLRRYLGDSKDRFPGQESKHFRILIAEIVADAVCALLVRRNVLASPEEFEDADWDTFYALHSKYMTQFLPIAHKLQCPEG